MNRIPSSWAPTQLPAPAPEADRRPTDRLAVTAFCVAIFPLILLGYAILAEWTALPFPDHPVDDLGVLAMPAGFVLGLIAAIRLGRGGDRRRGLALAVAAMMLPIVFFLLMAVAFLVVASDWYEEGLALATALVTGPPPA